ncbi:MAG: DUF192 domain-containing protein [Candidatus Omnitrophica bacterium]|nr:DUF192 domain-containing protein [Candidatus Omnitrophota bacterium]
MKIFNATRKTLLADNAIMADTFLKRAKGLLGKREFHYGQALVLNPCNSVHTCFMRFPIDLLFVSKNNTVIKAIPKLMPFRLSPISAQSRFVIELPLGTIKFTSTGLGDQLILK